MQHIHHHDQLTYDRERRAWTRQRATMSISPTSSPRWWSMFNPRTRHGQIYLSLLAVRCCSALYGHGYIHPDEWMQSGEPYFGLSTPGVDADTPWEWQPDKALRSLSTLVIQYAAVEPMIKIVKVLHGSLAGRSLFHIQRINMLLWTLALDISVVSVLPHRTARYVHYLFGISTAATTFLIRPFSNSHEAHLLAFCLLHASIFFRSPTWYTRGSMTGWHWAIPLALMAVDGFFTRFTFAIFALPLAVLVLYRHAQAAIGGHGCTAFRSLSTALAAAAVFFGLRIESETNFYTRSAKAFGMQVADLAGTGWVVPPINALLYNVKTENVAQHGLHPRWLHAVVNLPMMIGVANCVVIVIYGWHFVRDQLRPSSISEAPSTTAVEQDGQERKEVEPAIDVAASDIATASNQPDRSSVEHHEPYVDIERTIVGLSLSIVMSSLVILSISPHQEPRFLLALAFPSTVIMAYALQHPYFALRPRFVRTLCILHVAQHLIQLLLFSFLHQAALLPTLFSIDTAFSRLPLSSNSLFDRYEHHLLYRTFTVPFHLLPNKGSGLYPRVEQYDGSTSPEYVVQVASDACDHSWIYAPSWVVSDLQQHAERQAKVQLVKVDGWSWHVDLDHLGESWRLVAEVGWRQAFAIQKLHVRCERDDASRVGVLPRQQQQLEASSHEEL